MSAHVSERMSAYVDRELPPADRAGVDAHLRECPDCARAVEEMRALDALARGQEVQAPEGYFDALPGRLRGRLAPRAHARVPPWTLALAAGLAVALLAPLALRRAPPP
ncbi:MAG TPA: anti-sigma factor, partial [Vicinamibacteria bacterium]|nr:anti-sigma factor [Vicinamibacteria bacterium]